MMTKATNRANLFGFEGHVLLAKDVDGGYTATEIHYGDGRSKALNLPVFFGEDNRPYINDKNGNKVRLGRIR